MQFYQYVYFNCRDSCKQIKKKQCAFAVCQLTANKPNDLCRVLAHGKEATRRPPVCLGGRRLSLEKALPRFFLQEAHGTDRPTAQSQLTAKKRRTAKRWLTAKTGTRRRVGARRSAAHGAATAHGKDGRTAQSWRTA
jgi:hypothetical protein